jgi:RNA polymerase sigma factor (sigma-70 family)
VPSNRSGSGASWWANQGLVDAVVDAVVVARRASCGMRSIQEQSVDPNDSGCSAVYTVMRHIRPARSTKPEPILDFDTFFLTEYQRLFQTMYLLVRNRMQAEDIAQEAMARTYERWRGIHDPAGYVYRTAFNLHRNWRRRLAVAAASMRELAPAPDEVDAAERRLDALRALAALSRTQREALVLVEWAGMTAEEAGRVLGIQPVSVRGRVHRAKTRLRQRMGGPDG